jgi:dienelactone hydrolase
VCGLLSLALLCAACSGSSPRLHVRLDAGPVTAPFDTPVHVTLTGLPPSGLVTLDARTTDYQGRVWVSSADYRATAAGTLNLSTAVPVAGSYHVADAAGLLWSLHPAFTRNPATQFLMSYTGFSVTMRVLAEGRIQAAATLRREATAPASIQTMPRDGLAGTLFVPPKVKPGAPAVVVIGGSEGGEDIFTADALALIGYPALALGYFREPGLPQCLCDIPLEYFARAVHWLHAQPAARGRRIILVGGSRGGEGALLVASYEPRLFDAVVAISPSAFVEPAFGDGGGLPGAAWTFHGRPLATDTTIPVANIRIPVLLSDGGQDQVWPSGAFATVIMEELRTARDRAPYTSLYYPGAGHAAAGEPPYFPYSDIGPGGEVLGGSEPANALAAEQFWAKMIKFINDPSVPLK